MIIQTLSLFFSLHCINKKPLFIASIQEREVPIVFSPCRSRLLFHMQSIQKQLETSKQRSTIRDHGSQRKTLLTRSLRLCLFFWLASHTKVTSVVWHTII